MTAPSFSDHVALIKQQDGLEDGPAKLQAWCEGPGGLERRQNRNKEQDHAKDQNN